MGPVLTPLLAIDKRPQDGRHRQNHQAMATVRSQQSE